MLPRSGTLIFLRGRRRALGSGQNNFLGKGKVLGVEQGTEEGKCLKVTLSGKVIAEGPCGDGDGNSGDDGRHCLSAMCHMQENLTPMATAQESMRLGDTATSIPWVLHTHLLN